MMQQEVITQHFFLCFMAIFSVVVFLPKFLLNFCSNYYNIFTHFIAIYFYCCNIAIKSNFSKNLVDILQEYSCSSVVFFVRGCMDSKDTD